MGNFFCARIDCGDGDVDVVIVVDGSDGFGCGDDGSVDHGESY